MGCGASKKKPEAYDPTSAAPAPAEVSSVESSVAPEGVSIQEERRPRLEAAKAELLREQLGIDPDVPIDQVIAQAMEQLELRGTPVDAASRDDGLTLEQQADACLEALGVELPAGAGEPDSGSGTPSEESERDALGAQSARRSSRRSRGDAGGAGTAEEPSSAAAAAPTSVVLTLTPSESAGEGMEEREALRAKVASLAGVDASLVQMSVEAGRVTATIAVPVRRLRCQYFQPRTRGAHHAPGLLLLTPPKPCLHHLVRHRPPRPPPLCRAPSLPASVARPPPPPELWASRSKRRPPSPPPPRPPRRP